MKKKTEKQLYDECEKKDKDLQKKILKKLNPEEAAKFEAVELAKTILTDAGVPWWLIVEEKALGVTESYGCHSWCPISFDAKGALTKGAGEFAARHYQGFFANCFRMAQDILTDALDDPSQLNADMVLEYIYENYVIYAEDMKIELSP